MKIQNTQNFGHKIKQFTELPALKCVLCDNSLLRSAEVDVFIKKVCGQNASMPSAQSINHYLDTLRFQKPTKMHVLSEMEEYAKRYPDKSFGEIFSIPEVLSHHLQKAHEYYAENFEKNRSLFDLMEKGLNLSPEQKIKLAELHKKAVNISIGNLDNRVKRYLIRKNYADFQSEIGGAATAKLLEYAKQIPLSPGSPDLFLCRMAGKTDSHIMQGMLSPVTPMKKRINSSAGEGIFVCQSCSSAMGQVPLDSLFYIFPRFFENIQNQLDYIISNLAKGNLRGHADYPQILQRIILKATNGEKKLNLDKYFEAKKEIVKRASSPVSLQEIKARKKLKQENFEKILLREPSDTIKGYLVVANKRKEELLKNGATALQIQAQDNEIMLLRKIYIQALRRDKKI